MIWSHRHVEQDSVPQMSDGSKLGSLITLGVSTVLALVEHFSRHLVTRLLHITDSQFIYVLLGVWGLGAVVVICLDVRSRFIGRRNRGL